MSTSSYTPVPSLIPITGGTLPQQLAIKQRFQKLADNEARIWKESLGEDAYAADHTELIETIAYEIHFKELLDLDTAMVLAWEMIG